MRFDVIDDAERKRVAQEVGDRLALLGADPASSPHLEESISLWTMNFKSFLEGAPAQKEAENIRRWHHQISLNKQPFAYAQSTEPALGADPSAIGVVSQVVMDEVLSEKIDKVIHWLQTQEPGAVARLMIIPQYVLHLMWLVRDDISRFVIVDLPFGPLETPILEEFSEDGLREAMKPYRPITGLEPTEVR